MTKETTVLYSLGLQAAQRGFFVQENCFHARRAEVWRVGWNSIDLTLFFSTESACGKGLLFDLLGYS